MDPTPTIVPVSWLKDRIAAGNGSVKILDVTWMSNKDAHSDYLKSHIPGALYYDMTQGVENTALLPRNIPTGPVFQGQMRELGVNTGDHVVLYDNTPQHGFYVAGRVWWLLRLYGHAGVSILDGGFAKWQAESALVSTEIPKVEHPGNFEASYRSHLRKTFEDMQENSVNPQFQVVDARPAAKFKGTVGEARTGHYATAINIPVTQMLLDDVNKTFKTTDELKKIFQEKGVDLQRPLVAMCNSGMGACALMLAAYVSGSTDASVYHGGFIEWSKRDAPLVQD